MRCALRQLCSRDVVVAPLALVAHKKRQRQRVTATRAALGAASPRKPCRRARRGPTTRPRPLGPPPATTSRPSTRRAPAYPCTTRPATSTAPAPTPPNIKEDRRKCSAACARTNLARRRRREASRRRTTSGPRRPARWTRSANPSGASRRHEGPSDRCPCTTYRRRTSVCPRCRAALPTAARHRSRVPGTRSRTAN